MTTIEQGLLLQRQAVPAVCNSNYILGARHVLACEVLNHLAQQAKATVLLVCQPYLKLAQVRALSLGQAWVPS